MKLCVFYSELVMVGILVRFRVIHWLELEFQIVGWLGLSLIRLSLVVN